MFSKIICATVLSLFFAGSVSAQEIHGFLQVEGTSSALMPKLARAWVNLNARASPSTTIFIQMDGVAAELLDAEISSVVGMATDATLAVRAGNLLTPAGMIIPSPQDEQLVGGPAVGQLVQFYAQGAEVLGSWRSLQVRIGLVRGVSRLTELLGSVAYSGSAAKAAATFQTTGQYSRASAMWHVGSPTIYMETHVAAEVVGKISWAGSIIGGFELHERITLTAQADEIRIPTKADDHQLRLQVATKIAGVTFAIQEAWSSVSSFVTTVRLQGAF